MPRAAPVFWILPQVFKPGDYDKPGTGKDFLSHMHLGVIKFALAHKFKSSSEDGCTVKKDPITQVFVTKDFAVGQFKLVAFSNSISFVKEKDAKENPSKNCVLGNTGFECAGDKYVGVVNRHLTFPAEVAYSGVNKSGPATWIAKYWACKESVEEERANAERELIEQTVKVGTTTHKTEIPIITNTKAL